MAKRVRISTTDGKDHYANLLNANSMAEVQQMVEQQEWWLLDDGETLLRTASISYIRDATPRAGDESDADAAVIERTLPGDPRDY